MKFFEVTNHLGNVTVTISDKPIKVFNSSGELLYYKADVINATDYYPFGMSMPGRTYTAASTSSYRYGFNGQEKTKEVGEEFYEAKFWEYDSRTGRRWNVVHVLKIGESPYSTFSNNPILRSDPDGDTDSTGNLSKINFGGPGPITPKFSIRIGDTGGPWNLPEASTSIFSIYGHKTYYNSSPNGNGSFRIDEPNSFIQIQWRPGGKDNNFQIGINWFKQKFRENADGFGYEAPTAVQGSFAINKDLATFGNKINISSNFSFGAGIELGMPRNKINSSIIFDTKRILGTKYSLIGVGASAIYRIDATYSKHWTLFVAGTLHHLQTFDQKLSSGELKGEAIGSLAISAGG